MGKPSHEPRGPVGRPPLKRGQHRLTENPTKVIKIESPSTPSLPAEVVTIPTPPLIPLTTTITTLFTEAEGQLQNKVVNLLEEKIPEMVRSILSTELQSLRDNLDAFKLGMLERVNLLEESLGEQLKKLVSIAEANKPVPQDEEKKAELNALISKYPSFATTTKFLNRMKRLKKRGRPTKLKTKSRYEEVLKPTNAPVSGKHSIPSIEKKKRGRKRKFIEANTNEDLEKPQIQESSTYLEALPNADSQQIQQPQLQPQQAESENQSASQTSIQGEPTLNKLCSVEDMTEPLHRSPHSEIPLSFPPRQNYPTFANLSDSFHTSRFPSDILLEKTAVSKTEEPSSALGKTSKTSLADLLLPPMSTHELGMGNRFSNENSQSSRNQAVSQPEPRRRSLNESKYLNDSKAFSFD